MDEIQIIDVILHKNQYSTQTFVVVNRMPNLLYEKKGDFLIGEDSGFFSFYQYDRPSKGFEAFGGRKFDIPMKDGSIIKAFGQWWAGCPNDYSELGLLYGLGINTPGKLSSCNVFSSSNVDKQIVDNWLSENEPSNNYDKYDKRNKDYMVQTIVSKFDE